MIVNRKIWLVSVFVPLCLGMLVAIYSSQRDAMVEDIDIAATVLPNPKMLSNFSLQDHQGKDFSREDLLGQWSMIFFGYTHCPDVCPATLATLNQVMNVLHDTPEIDMPRVIFISVDPKRDTATLLANYVAYFNDQFIGATGSLSNLKALTMPLGIVFGIEGDDSESSDYDVFHSPRIMLIDPQARFKALFSFPHDVTEIATAYIKIISF